MAVVSVIRSSRVIARSREVTAYHRNAEKPGKPLYLLIPGGVITGAALAAIALIGYRAWGQRTMPESEGIWWIVVLLLPYFCGLLMFSYGYELYNWPKAIRLTLILGVIGLAIIVVFAAIVAALAALGEHDGDGEHHSSSGSSHSGSDRSGSFWDLSGLNLNIGGGSDSRPPTSAVAAGERRFGRSDDRGFGERVKLDFD